MTSPTINSQIVGGMSVGQEELQAGEEIVAATPTSRRQFGILYGGRLVLTNQRLVFLPGRTHSQRPNVSFNLDSITNIREKRMRFALILGGRFALPIVNTPAIGLETTSGRNFDFQLGENRTGDRARWMEMLRKAMTRTANGG